MGERSGYLEHIREWEMLPLMMESSQDTTDFSWKYSAALARSTSSWTKNYEIVYQANSNFSKLLEAKFAGEHKLQF